MPSISVVGTRVAAISTRALLVRIGDRSDTRPLGVAFANVHTVMSCRQDPALAAAIEAMDIVAPDGVPISWAMRLLAGRSARTRGADFFRCALKSGVDRGWKHYLFGSTPETLDELSRAAESLAPGVKIVGQESPPFRTQTTEEKEGSVQRIRASGADCVWVGLGMPKQELWIAEAREHLPGTVLLGVGAAFDFIAGTAKEAPAWMQKSGLEWLFRLVHEPRRLWRRYLWNNPAFLVLLAGQVVKERVLRRPPRTPAS